MTIGAMANPQLMIFNEDFSHPFRDNWTHPVTRTEAGLRAYVAEIASGGKFTHFFMNPNGMCASFDSKVLEPCWWDLATPGRKDDKHNWMRNAQRVHDAGIDIYAVWTDECRRRGLSPWMSIRMNDVHWVFDESCAGLSRFWREHRELWRVPSGGDPKGAWEQRGFDYSHIEVRDRMLRFIAECLERYDLDGIECDWMRSVLHLSPGREQEQKHVLDAFMAEVRRLCNQASTRRGHRVMVGVRVASRPEAALGRGTDVFAWAKAGSVDWIIPCNFYGAVDFFMPYGEWKKRVEAANPSVKVIPGMDQGTMGEKTGRRPLVYAEYLVFANLMYAQGAEGVYMFNLFDHAADNDAWNNLIQKGLPKMSTRHD